jgi:hypothetical protein
MQVKDFLLCADCEERFSKYERWAAGQVYDGRDFPLLLRLTLALPFLETPRLRGVSGVAAGIDTEKLAYFGLSILWRGAAHKWKMRAGKPLRSTLEVMKIESERFCWEKPDCQAT